VGILDFSFGKNNYVVRVRIADLRLEREKPYHCTIYHFVSTEFLLSLYYVIKEYDFVP
jgi:hypothetical protein